MWHILRKVLKWKAYKPHVSTVLSHKQCQARVNTAQWFLSHDAEFFSKQVIRSDEKYFVLKQGPNKGIHRYWVPTNPNIIIECKSQSQQKVICWSGLCNDEACKSAYVRFEKLRIVIMSQMSFYSYFLFLCKLHNNSPAIMIIFVVKFFF